eukprot:gene20679-26810_t
MDYGLWISVPDFFLISESESQEAVEQSLFEEFGDIIASKVIRTPSGLCKGFGFIEFRTKESAKQAIQERNEYIFNGKRLKVSYSRAPSPDIQNCKVYVSNLPSQYTVSDVRNIFQQFGEIIECRVPTVHNNSNAIAFVQFAKRYQAERALSLNGKILKDTYCRLSVKFADTSKSLNTSSSKTSITDLPSIASPLQYTPTNVVIDPSTGFGFVEYANKDCANQAIKQRNEFVFNGKKLKVSYSRESSPDIKNCKIYVSNLPLDFNVNDVRNLFNQFGDIIECRVPDVKSSGNPIAFVQFAKRDQAEKALSFNGAILNGSNYRIAVKFADSMNSNSSTSDSLSLMNPCNDCSTSPLMMVTSSPMSPQSVVYSS